jgi:predicted dehydrogenase
MNKLKVAIVGCGNIYKNHADALKDSEYAELAYVVDIKENKAFEASREYNCKYATDFNEILENPDIDVVNICTPHYLHAPMAIAAMKAGKQVFTEKPMCISVAEAREMNRVAKDTGKHLGVCFQNRFNATTVRAKELLDSGELGNILGIKAIVTWFRSKPYYAESDWRGNFSTEGGGVLINQAIHTLDLIQWLGGGISKLKANIDTRILEDTIEVEDTADATFIFNKGFHGIFYATNCFTTNSPIEVEFHCEKGSLHFYDKQLFFIKDGNRQLIETDMVDKGKYKDYWGLGHSIIMERFYKGVAEHRKDLYVTGEEGIKAIELIENIYRSSASHRWVEI